MNYKLPDLPYPASALEPFIDAKTMEIHHDKHHAGYVEKLNKALESMNDVEDIEINELIKVIDKFPKDTQESVRNNGGGHANHSLFWKIMTPEKKDLDSSTELAKAIDKEFKDMTSFQSRFTEEALSRFGSGWAWLVAEEGVLSIISTPNQDSPLMQNLTPILGIDVWEHAYYLKYQNKRAEYVEAWWNVVNWEEVARRYNEASKQ